MPRYFIISFSVLALAACADPSAPHSQAVTALAAQDAAPTRIETDQDTGTIRFIVNGQEQARIDGTGLHVRQGHRRRYPNASRRRALTRRRMSARRVSCAILAALTLLRTTSTYAQGYPSAGGTCPTPGIFTQSSVTNASGYQDFMFCGSGGTWNSPVIVLTTTGDVGIGTTTPGSLLTLSGGSSDPVVSFNTNGSTGGLVFEPSTANTNGQITVVPSAARLVPICFSHPAVLMSVHMRSASAALMHLEALLPMYGTSGQLLGEVSANSWPIYFYVSNTTQGRFPAAVILNSGSVGIGTTTPAYPLDIQGATERIDPGSGSSNATLYLVGRSSGTAGQARIFADWGGGIGLIPAASGSGAVGINAGPVDGGSTYGALQSMGASRLAEDIMVLPRCQQME